MNYKLNSKIALQIIKEHGGIIKTMDAIRAGIHSRVLYRLRNEGLLICLARGIYQLADAPDLSAPDLITVSTQYPKAVICLISALSFHEITTQIPHQVFIALPSGAKSPTMKQPSLSVHRFSKRSYSEGIEYHLIDGIDVPIYCPEKTLADCFKFRNKIGMDVVLEALHFYRQRKKFKGEELMHYARICRVENVMRPYLETII